MEDNELESGQVRQVVAPRSIALDFFLSAEILVATEAARLICWRLRKLLCKYTVDHFSETLLLSISSMAREYTFIWMLSLILFLFSD